MEIIFDKDTTRVWAARSAHYYALLSTRCHSKLLVREALHDGRFKKERAIRKFLRGVSETADRKSRAFSQIFTALTDVSVRAVA